MRFMRGSNAMLMITKITNGSTLARQGTILLVVRCLNIITMARIVDDLL